MRDLRFHEIVMASQVERAARIVAFNENATIIRGPNDTGKSSIVKAIYGTLGAEAHNVHPRWKAAKVTTSLRFSLDGISYRMLRIGSRFVLFDSADHKTAAFTSVTKQLAPYLADLFVFHLLLLSDGIDTQATPAFLFLPFYVDQDGGWNKTLSSFRSLQQFSGWRTDLVSFHTGVRPSEYYQAKARASECRRQISELLVEHQSVTKLAHDLRKRLRSSDFDVDIEVFRKEIEQLLVRVKELRAQQAVLRRRMTEIFNRRSSIKRQIQIVERAAEELHKDREFAAEQLGDTITCPICHAEYENGFSERFDIAMDEDRCQQLLVELRRESDDVDRQWQDARHGNVEASAAVHEVEKLLSRRRRKIELRDLLRREGQKDVTAMLEKRLRSIDRKIGREERLLRNAEDEMKTFRDHTKAKAAKETYVRFMEQLLEQLEVKNIKSSAYNRMDAQVSESGSDLPRAILAYVLALSKTIKEFGNSTFCPLVIDSPRQQDQDVENWRGMLHCIRDQRPEGQLVLALVDDLDVDFGGDVIELREKQYVLERRAYDRAMDELSPLIREGVKE